MTTTTKNPTPGTQGEDAAAGAKGVTGTVRVIRLSENFCGLVGLGGGREVGIGRGKGAESRPGKCPGVEPQHKGGPFVSRTSLEQVISLI